MIFLHLSVYHFFCFVIVIIPQDHGTPVASLESKGDSVLESDLSFVDKYQIAHEILAYLAEHPEANDTLEGITEWWLLERKIRYQAKLVKEALTELLENGLILQHRNGDSQVHYQTNRSKGEEIRVLLRKSNER